MKILESNGALVIKDGFLGIVRIAFEFNREEKSLTIRRNILFEKMAESFPFSEIRDIVFDVSVSSELTIQYRMVVIVRERSFPLTNFGGREKQFKAAERACQVVGKDFNNIIERSVHYLVKNKKLTSAIGLLRKERKMSLEEAQGYVKGFTRG